MLTIRDLCVVYPNGIEALKSINLSAERGEVIAIIGRSGAGKSTLFRCINGLQHFKSGSIVLDGAEISALDERSLRLVQRQIGFIWQEYNLVNRLSVFGNVLIGRLGYNPGFGCLFGYFEREARMLAIYNLERVNLLHLARQRADQLSGGEKQRVSIARAMTQQPKLILADEPVASLDPALSRQIIGDLLRLTREDNVLTIINSHQIDLAREFADRIIGISDGLVVFNGKPSELDADALHRIYKFEDHSDHSQEFQSTRKVAKITSLNDSDNSLSGAGQNAININRLRMQLLNSLPHFGLVSTLLMLMMFVVLIWASIAVQPDMAQITRGKPPLVALWDFLIKMFPPQFDYTTVKDSINIANLVIFYPLALLYIVQTLQMALVGTLLGVILSIPAGLLAARNTSPHPIIYQSTRLVLNTIRAIPPLIWALIFVSVAGLGPFSGVLALAVAGVGSKGKLYAEAVESIDPQQVLAVQATGAERSFVFVYGVIPQALPIILSYSLLSFESNVRDATILGYVGAGGIGLLIYQYISLFQFDRLLGVIIFIVVTVTVIDRISDFLRRKFI